MNKILLHRALTIAGAAIVLSVSFTASAQWKDWDYDLDQEKKPWAELQTQLPPYPKPENLLRFDTGTNTSNQYFVDAASISIGEDKVVRYSLVVRTGGGATNVSFEGIRCDAAQLRVYAFGHPGTQWSRARDVNWRAIEYREVNGHHNTLFRNFMCTQSRNREAANLRDIVAALKRGGPSVPGY